MLELNLTQLNKEHTEKEILIYGRVHNIRKVSKNMCFIVMRNGIHTLQCVGLKKDLKDSFDLLVTTPTESYIHIIGTLSKLPDSVPKILSCFYQDFELRISSFEIISLCKNILPFQIDDANTVCYDDSERNNVLLPTRLDNRYFDLRTPLNGCIFKLQSGIINAFRECLINDKFIEIHSPKLLGTSSETGASTFKLTYFNKQACLAQSPQLYKQMAINADFNAVFEIGPVFRAENATTHRHLCEFTGLDIEMALKPPYSHFQIINKLWNILTYIFNSLETQYALESTYLRNIHETKPLCFPTDALIINFKDGVKLLEEHGFTQSLYDDLTTENERQLGYIIKNKYNSDLFVLEGYPTSARPFYSMPSSDPLFTNSYDIIMRGEEICSGSQRQHNYESLLEKIKETGSNVEAFEDYLNSFKYGSPPHGGGGFGLERILSLYYELKNVRLTSLFPRDPSRLKP